MKKVHYLMIVLVSAACLIACGPRLDTAKTTKNDLKDYETFAYLPNSNYDASDYTPLDIEKTIVKSVNKNMKKMGYKLDRTNPDLLVLIRKRKDTDADIQTDNLYATYPYVSVSAIPVSPQYDPYYYLDYDKMNMMVKYDSEIDIEKEVLMTIDLIDRKTKKMVWRGSIKDELDNTNVTDAMASNVDRLFTLFGTETVAGY
ncbi:DUF4136 domain-containing protein [Aquimarina sp. M1]